MPRALDRPREDREEVEQSEDHPDRHRRVPDSRRDAKGEQADEHEVDHRAGRSAKRRAVAERDEGIPIPEAGVGEEESAGDETACDTEGARHRTQHHEVHRLRPEHRHAARDRGEGRADHAGAVLLGDDKNAEHGDDRLAEVDADEAEFGRVLQGLAADVDCARDECAEPGREHDDCQQEPGGAG